MGEKGITRELTSLKLMEMDLLKFFHIKFFCESAVFVHETFQDESIYNGLVFSQLIGTF